jgi:hypothetical protein
MESLAKIVLRTWRDKSWLHHFDSRKKMDFPASHVCHAYAEKVMGCFSADDVWILASQGLPPACGYWMSASAYAHVGPPSQRVIEQILSATTVRHEHISMVAWAVHGHSMSASDAVDGLLSRCDSSLSDMCSEFIRMGHGAHGYDHAIRGAITEIRHHPKVLHTMGYHVLANAKMYIPHEDRDDAYIMRSVRAFLADPRHKVPWNRVVEAMEQCVVDPDTSIHMVREWMDASLKTHDPWHIYAALVWDAPHGHAHVSQSSDFKKVVKNTCPYLDVGESSVPVSLRPLIWVSPSPSMDDTGHLRRDRPGSVTSMMGIDDIVHAIQADTKDGNSLMLSNRSSGPWLLHDPLHAPLDDLYGPEGSPPFSNQDIRSIYALRHAHPRKDAFRACARLLSDLHAMFQSDTGNSFFGASHDDVIACTRLALHHGIDRMMREDPSLMDTVADICSYHSYGGYAMAGCVGAHPPYRFHVYKQGGHEILVKAAATCDDADMLAVLRHDAIAHRMPVTHCVNMHQCKGISDRSRRIIGMTGWAGKDMALETLHAWRLDARRGISWTDVGSGRFPDPVRTEAHDMAILIIPDIIALCHADHVPYPDVYVFPDEPWHTRAHILHMADIFPSLPRCYQSHGFPKDTPWGIQCAYVLSQTKRRDHHAWMDAWILDAWSHDTHGPLLAEVMTSGQIHPTIKQCIDDRPLDGLRLGCRDGIMTIIDASMRSCLREARHDISILDRVQEIWDAHRDVSSRIATLDVSHDIVALYGKHPLIEQMALRLIAHGHAVTGFPPHAVPDVLMRAALHASRDIAHPSFQTAYLKETMPPWMSLHGISTSHMKSMGLRDWMPTLPSICDAVRDPRLFVRFLYDAGIPESSIIHMLLAYRPEFLGSCDAYQ